ncbi:MAG: Rnase Y domain-containing protein, partial [Chloroflexota bacterium]
MSITMFAIIEVLTIVLVAAIAGALGYYYKQNQVEKAKLLQKDEAERILIDAKEKARQIEISARDQALQVIQKAEGDLERRRSELSREEDRLQKRREELDNRL